MLRILISSADPFLSKLFDQTISNFLLLPIEYFDIDQPLFSQEFNGGVSERRYFEEFGGVGICATVSVTKAFSYCGACGVVVYYYSYLVLFLLKRTSSNYFRVFLVVKCNQ